MRLIISKSNHHTYHSEVRKLSLLLLPPQFPHVRRVGDWIMEYRVQGLQTLVSVQLHLPATRASAAESLPAFYLSPLLCMHVIGQS